MKLVLLSFFFLLLRTIAVAQQDSGQGFTLGGRIMGKDSGYVYLYYKSKDRFRVDSCLVKDGYFSFKGEIPEPYKAHFAARSPGVTSDYINDVDFFIEPGQISLYGKIDHMEDFEVSGSVSDLDRVKLMRLKSHLEAAKRPVVKAFNECYRSRRNSSMTGYPDSMLKKRTDSLFRLADSLQKKEIVVDSLFVLENPASFVAADILARGGIQFPALDKLYSRLPVRVRSSGYGRQIAYEIEKQKNIPVGSPAKDFIAVNERGDTIHLLNYKGKKYVLLDFWASWCGPCREMTRSIKKLHDRFGSVMEIISISNEKNESDWHRAIETDHAIWQQVLENKDIRAILPGGTTITGSYYVNTIPCFILIDKEFRIAEKFGGSYYGAKSVSSLESELNKIFQKNEPETL